MKRAMSGVTNPKLHRPTRTAIEWRSHLREFGIKPDPWKLMDAMLELQRRKPSLGDLLLAWGETR